MKPMTVEYERSKDQMTYAEETLTFIFDRMI